ncbi:MAG: GGDEF domain-containing protein, partial [Planctomycetota bacterium]
IAIDGLESLRATRGFEFVSEAVGQVGELLRDCTRGCDHLGSLVDRRLVVVLPHTDRAGAEALGRRLVEAADGLQLDHEGQRIPITISVGISTFSQANTMFFDALTDGAEVALQKARRDGGARVEYCEPGGEL